MNTRFVKITVTNDDGILLDTMRVRVEESKRVVSIRFRQYNDPDPRADVELLLPAKENE